MNKRQFMANVYCKKETIFGITYQTRFKLKNNKKSYNKNITVYNLVRSTYTVFH